MTSLYCNLNMIGYKIAKVGGEGGIRVVVTLVIPSDAVTNIGRKDIVDVTYAKHRTNKARVIDIEDENRKKYKSARSFNYGDKYLDYKLNTTLIIDDYDMNLDRVCSSGIHFFLHRRCAELYGLECVKNGLFEVWYENGQIKSKCEYVNGQIHGNYTSWHDNGRRWCEVKYNYGLKHGVYKRWWYGTDQLMEKITYMNGIIHGLYESWTEYGVKEKELIYVNGNCVNPLQQQKIEAAAANQ